MRLSRFSERFLFIDRDCLSYDQAHLEIGKAALREINKGMGYRAV